MLKNMLMNSTRINYAPDDEKGSEKPEDKVEDKEVKKEEEKEPEKEEVEKEETDEDEVEEKDEEKVELSAEQKEIAKLKKTIVRLQNRVDRTTAEKTATANELIAAKASLDAKVGEGQGLSEEEVERRANAKAQQLAIENQFNNAQTKLIKDATKLDAKFMEKINEVQNDVAPLPGYIIGILEDIDNGAAVLAHLVNDVDLYEEVYNLSPAKMSRALDKIALKLEEDAKPKPKAISKAPKPNESIKGGSSSPGILPSKPTENMEQFIKVRNEQAEQHRKRKLGIAS